MKAARDTADRLTLRELADVLAAALGGNYDGVRNGRVRDLPDGRTIRWYQTLGIVDRPTVFRGRTALYGPRHILQLAAVKQLQRAGLPLADIQRGLAGLNDAELARAAGITRSAVDQLVATTRRNQPESDAAPVKAEPAGPRRDAAFWSFQSAATASPRPLPETASQPMTLQTLALGGPVAVVWEGRPLAPHEIAAVSRLSRPLVDFLASLASGPAAEPAGRVPQPSARPETETRP